MTMYPKKPTCVWALPPTPADFALLVAKLTKKNLKNYLEYKYRSQELVTRS